MTCLFSVQDLCDRCTVSQQTVLGWINSGELAAVNVGRKPGGKKPRWRITQAALDAFEAARASCPPPPRPAQRRRSRDDVIEFYK
jgi:excisionase family DNA binding protein